MTKSSVVAIIFTLLLGGCEETDSTGIELGSYSGDFMVIYDHGLSSEYFMTGPTVLTLDKNGYNLTENTRYYPPKSEGKYSKTLTSISFQDTIMHTCEFDHSLIIGSTYTYSFDGATLNLSKTVPERNRKYRFILTRD